MTSTALATIREAMSRFDPAATHEARRPPELAEIYAPVGHEAALDPERALVEGGRGMGKSFWSGALTHDAARAVLATAYPGLALGECLVRLGFAAGSTTPGGPPSRVTLDELIDTHGYPPELVWRAIVWRFTRLVTGADAPDNWTETVALCAESAERVELDLHAADEKLRRDGRRLLIVFDALDQTGRDWRAIRSRSQALLRVALAMRQYRALKPKIFVRTDQFADEDLFAFPDASKLRSGVVNLTWGRRDLFGLAYSRLAADGRAGEEFRSMVAEATSLSIPVPHPVMLPKQLKDIEAIQRTVFTRLAGPYMGSNARRGKTYDWLHNHLADALGMVSPRSFLIALRHAALYRPAPEQHVVSPKGLEAGVRAASTTRVDQLGEDYRWIQQALTPLADLSVPCPDDRFRARWQDAGTLDAIRAAVGREEYLGPVELSLSPASDPDALLEALRRIGVVERRPDGRINIPDIFRIAAKLLKRGGVPPGRR